MQHQVSNEENTGPGSTTPGGAGGAERTLYVVKIGGNIIDDEAKLTFFLQLFSQLRGHKILVHGGGKMATRLAEKLNLPQQLIDGRRVTDAQTLEIVTMVYAGLVNKTIVAKLQATNCNAIGITGADGNAILAHQRESGTTSYGFVGDVDEINVPLFTSLLHQNNTVVVAPITHNGKGQLLNTNADTVAQEIAKSLAAKFDVQLVYSFEKKGVLLNASDESTVIPVLNNGYYLQLKASQRIFAGMLPKLDNAFLALTNGVKKVIIGRADELLQLVEGTAGTTITNE